MTLTPENVTKLLLSLLFEDDEIKEFDTTDKDNYPDVIKKYGVFVDGVVATFVFDSRKITEDVINEIISLLDELPLSFKEGQTFLLAALDKDANHWGEHPDAENLLALGIAIGKVENMFPDRSLWYLLPGNVPYFIYRDDNEPKVEPNFDIYFFKKRKEG